MPVVQPNGTVVVIGTQLNGQTGSALIAFTSTDGGASWTAPTAIATIAVRTIPGLRAMTKPTVDVDATGRVTLAWADCRFQAGCTANGIVTASSTDGIAWGEPTQVLLPDTTSDVVNPSFAIAPGTSGATAQLSVAYYALVSCATTCLDARYATSYDGGQTWSTPYTLNTTPMPTTWFANSPRGRMVGDYTSVCFVHGSAVSLLPLVTAAPTPYTQTMWALTLPPGFVPV
jgi:hypothetical protein